jgi:hypothetical protein
MIGCNDGEFEDFLLEELDSYNPLLKPIRDPSLPAALGAAPTSGARPSAGSDAMRNLAASTAASQA